MNEMLKNTGINDSVYKLVLEEEKNLKDYFENIDNNAFLNSLKVINAFKIENVNESDFASSTGYGYNDLGRDKIERIFAHVLGGEDALVRNQFISGTHALTTTLFGLLRPNDILLSISGLPYDTLHEVIGIKDNNSSLQSFNIKYEQIDLIDNDFDYNKIEDFLKNNKVKVITIQRSRGYSRRDSLTIDKIEKVTKFIKNINKNTIIMIDNCYCEFVENTTPLEVGCDIMVGSLIKNLGAGICENGAYVAGKKELIKLVSERLNVPGEGKDVGPSLGANKQFLMGLYHAPYAVASSLKIAILTSKVLARLGYNVSPHYNDRRADIVQTIIFNDREKLIKYACGIQNASAIDSNSMPVPTETPGYDDEIIMASGSFVQGSSIEISCDGPLKEPYIIFQQGSLTYDYGKIALMSAISKVIS